MLAELLVTVGLGTAGNICFSFSPNVRSSILRLSVLGSGLALSLEVAVLELTAGLGLKATVAEDMEVTVAVLEELAAVVTVEAVADSDWFIIPLK